MFHHRVFDLGLIGLLEFAPVFAPGDLRGATSTTASRGCSCSRPRSPAAGLSPAGADRGQRRSARRAVALSGARPRHGNRQSAVASPASRSLTADARRPRAAPAARWRSARSPTRPATVVGPGDRRPAVRARARGDLRRPRWGCSSSRSAAPSRFRIRGREPTRRARPAASTTLLAGISFIGGAPILLGAITLDLFAVLFGGAVALLPVFAQSILHTGPARPRRAAQRAGGRRGHRRRHARPPTAAGAPGATLLGVVDRASARA